MLAVDDTPIHRRAIGMHVEDRQEDPDAKHFHFQNLGLLDFANIFDDAVGCRDHRVRISWNFSIWIAKKEKRVEDQEQKKQGQPSAEKPAGKREKK